MLAKRAKLETPLREPTYSSSDIPWCKKDLDGSVVLRPSRQELQDSMAEIALLCSEATCRQSLKRGKKNGGPTVYSSKPLSIEFIADRLDIDDPLHAITVRTAKEGYLQGFVTWTPFTTWQKHFTWNSLSPVSQLSEWDGHESLKEGRLRDSDNTLAKELNNQIYEGDPDDGGIIWPRVAEIALLGAIGCGRWLCEAVIQELEIASSDYEYVVLQATTNSVPFYESLGFVRVGAVARYDLSAQDSDDEEDVTEYNFSKSHVCSPTYWYTDTKEDETPKKIATKTGVDVFEILFLNKILYGQDGFTANSRLKRGTPLRLPVKNSGGDGSTSKLKSAMYTTTAKESCKQIASRLNIPTQRLVELNRHRHKGIAANSTLLKGTQLLLPDPDGTSDEINDLSRLTDEVAYRHWTFNDDQVDYTEASYMMVRRLKPRNERRNTGILDTLGSKLGRGCPPVLRIPLGCKAPEVFEPSQTVAITAKSDIPVKLPKPKTAFELFRKEVTPQFRKVWPKKSNKFIEEEIESNWDAMSQQEKAPFKQESDKLQEEYGAKLSKYGKSIERPSAKGGRGSNKKAKSDLVPSKLFNKVVTVQGHPGVWFVLTYIPDLQWVHLGPMRQNGTFGKDRKGEVSEQTGHPRWMLAPEGSAVELDLSAFNVMPLKCKTIKKTQNADKEEWFLPELPDWLIEGEPCPPFELCTQNGYRSNSTMNGDDDTVESLHWFIPSASDSDGLKRIDKRAASNNAYKKGDFVCANWNGRGTYYPGQIVDILPFRDGVKPTPQNRLYSVRYDDGDFEYSVPPNRIRSKSKSASDYDKFDIGEAVLGDWQSRGKMYSGTITAVSDPDPTSGIPLYTILYEDNDSEKNVHPARLKKLDKAPSQRKRRRTE